MRKIIAFVLCFFLLSFTVLPFASVIAQEGVKTVEDFNDLKTLPQETKAKFDELIRGGVFSGLSEDTFGLDSKMDRAQFAKVATLIFSLPMDKTLAKPSFTDLGTDHWSFTYVEALKKAGLTNGYDSEGKMYNPSGEVSRQELAAFLIRGLGLDEPVQKAVPVADGTVDDWAKGYVTLALEKNIMTKLDNGTFGGKTPATRKMLVLASYEATKILAGPAASPLPSPTPATTPTPEPNKEDSGKVSAKGKRVLMTSDVNTSNPDFRKDDNMVVNRLQSLGFEVDRLASTKITAEAFEGYDLAYIGWSTNPKYVKKKLKSLPIPIIYSHSRTMGDADLSSVSENANADMQTEISIVKPDHPLAAGLSGDVQVHYEPYRLTYGVPSKDAIVVATVKGEPNKATIFAYEKGSKNIQGETVPARSAFFFTNLGTQMNDYATDEFWKLFDAEALWVIQNPE
ncbi:S-layer homology domain-containing protein [Paenibacillus doosanensis]|uniref:S-layer homology domain-containing protein n=1 Tax=Paenibacillus doosanensis TaxID=1229154 RepID=UPI0021802A35|nr:S-layer homology domain-containing protein [Paenibacillus doosanensis]MCS7460923.1 S-layer homology domain-containing protein [Paenibacillus doosanensis]